MAELADAAGVPVATIKYYRREGLLPSGEATAPNQAAYTDAHVERLRLIRSLREVADLSIAAIHDVLDAVDDPHRGTHEVVGAAHRALDPGGGPVDDQALARAAEVIREAGWQVSETAPARATLARALSALDELGVSTDPDRLDRYIRAADAVARDEVSAALGAPARSREAVVTSVVIGTVLFEQVLAAMRRLAQEHHSGRRA